MAKQILEADQYLQQPNCVAACAMTKRSQSDDLPHFAPIGRDVQELLWQLMHAKVQAAHEAVMSGPGR